MTTDLTPVLQSTGSFEAYLSFVNRQPVVDEQQERALFEDYQQRNDLEAAQRLILSHLRLVAYIAQSYKGYGLPLDDLVQEGTIGLMKSVKKFNLDFGVRLSSFAVHYIKAEIQEYVIRNWRLVKATTTKAKRKLFFNLRKLKSSTHWLTYKEKNEIAEQLQVSEGDVADMEVQLSHSDFYLNSSVKGEGDEHVHSDIILEDKSEPFAAKLIQQDFNIKVFKQAKLLIEELDERSRDIIENRWLAKEKLTQKYFSEKYGVSQERIRQIEATALARIRKKLAMLNN
ncbi:RNA polymerase factor sigma-32 [Thalassotalea sp. PS06]|uniref:RNA polymerase factor sigma-32 n=1 Tax=Thalassotalea sp. PS06 TaxID=2594005 RepID=UPI00116499A0|nr:RNA polymerase factor sigma-32 [Thalassotalea sp. PS06]QDP01909.1 sigma-70 family RNA polymerase sigma factor [Thalassotalea sp. PS06]